MTNNTVKTLSDHSSELADLVRPKTTLARDIVTQLGGIEVFNVVAGALMNGGTLDTFCAFKSENRAKKLFNNHKLEIMTLVAECAEKANHSPQNYLYNLCSYRHFNYNEIVKCYDILATDDLHSDADQNTLKRIDVMIHCIVIDIVTRVITDYNKSHYIIF